MEHACLRHTEVPHTSRLFLDFQYHFDRVSRFYSGSPADAQAYARAAAQLDYPDARRAALVQALGKRNAGSPALARLVQPGTVAVVTGQQVGLFSGPAYTIYKALKAVRLAHELSVSGIPAVPVFWLATEDHDFEEINHAFVFDTAHTPVTLRVENGGDGQRPVGTIPLEAPPVDQLVQAFQGLPFGDRVGSMVREAYQPGVTFGAAFEALLRRLLAPLDLLYLDPLDPAIREIAAPFLGGFLPAAPGLSRRLLERNQELAADGYHAQVHVEPNTSLVFLLEDSRRIALRRQNGEYVSKERRYSTEELVDRAAALSPNALLRPVMQDYLLPTVAYIGGPAELAYLAQSEVLYRELLGRMPVAVARTGFTLLDARSAKLLERYDLELPDVFHGGDELRERIAHRLTPVPLKQSFAEARRDAAEAIAKLRGSLAGFDPTLAKAMDKSGNKVLYQFAKMERKTEREAMRRDTRAADDSRYLSDLIYPEKHLQERYYSILPFLAKHGPDLIETLAEHVRLECPDHQVLVV